MAAGGLLVAYVLMLLGLTHYEQNAREDANAEQFRLTLEKRAAALAYFYSVRKDDLAALTDHRYVTSFFANRDLGMSMQYGLGASLHKMQLAVEQLVAQRLISGQRVYLRIMLREPDGNLLVDTQPGQESGFAQEVQLHPDLPQIFNLQPGQVESVMVAVPLRYKGRLMGHLLALINQGLVNAHLIATDNEAQGERVLLRVAGENESAAPNGPMNNTSAWHMQDGGVAGVARVAETPFEIYGSFPLEGLSAFFSSRWFSTSLLVLAAMILLGAWLAVRMRTDNLVLRAHIEEATRHEEALSHKNRELEQEILRRRAYEQELLQARIDAEAAYRAKSEFLSTISHELRTPLNAVLGVAQLMAAEDLDEHQAEWVELINKSGMDLLGMINGILDYTRIESGKMSLKIVPMDLQQSIDTVISQFTQRLSEKRLTLNLDYPPQLPRLFEADQNRIQQVLRNLLDNAIKFTSQGGIRIGVERLSSDQEGMHLRLSVRDSGTGISEEQQGRLFELFTQGDSSVTRRFGGAGMGLAISRKLVELMGGQIGVQSTLGEGSLFWFDLNLPLITDSP